MFNKVRIFVYRILIFFKRWLINFVANNIGFFFSSLLNYFMFKSGILIVLSTFLFLGILCSCKREHLPAEYFTPIVDTFSKIYINKGNDEIFSVINSPEGTYLFTGTTTTLSSGGKDVYIGEIDQNGRLLWSKTIGGAAEDGGRDILITPDNNLLISGYSRSFNINSNFEAYLIKTDRNGNVIWQKTLDAASSITKMERSNSNDGYIAVGGTFGWTSNLGRGVFISKLSDSGTIVWSKTYFGPNKNEMANNFSFDYSGNLMIVASAQDVYPNNDLFVLKTDMNGDTLWSKSIYGNGFEISSNIVNLDNNNFTICSSSGNVTDPLGITTITNIDNIGNNVILTSFQSNNPYSGNWMIKTTDNNLLLTGTQTDSLGNNPCYVKKLDFTGNVIWTKTFGDSLNYTVHHIMETNNSYIIVGAQNVPTDSTHALIIKMKKQ